MRNWTTITDQARRVWTDKNGWLRIDGVELTRETVNLYRGSELDPDGSLGLDPDATYRVYRSPEALQGAIDDFTTIDVSNDHEMDYPDGHSANARKGSVARATLSQDGAHLVVHGDVVVKDLNNISSIQNKQLNAFSVGYGSTLEVEPGVTPWGEQYDIKITSIVPNHLKLTDNPRVKTATITDEDFDESEHKRDGNGKFSATGSGGDSKKSEKEKLEIVKSTPKAHLLAMGGNGSRSTKGAITGEPGAQLINVTVKPVADIKAFRKETENWYKENLQGTSVEHSELGNILFSRPGLRKTISSNGTSEKLALVRYLPELIKSGESDGWNPINKDRNDGWTHFAIVKNSVRLNGKNTPVGVFIAKDRNGKAYYDLFIDKTRLNTSTNRGRGQSGSTAIIDDTIDEVNIFFTGADIADEFVESDHPRAADGKFDSGGSETQSTINTGSNKWYGKKNSPYDGYKLRLSGGEVVYVATDPKQIKSAERNSGRFNVDGTNIYDSKPTNQTIKEKDMAKFDKLFGFLKAKGVLKDDEIKEIEKELTDADYTSRFQAALKVAFPNYSDEQIAEIMSAISGVIADIEMEDKGVAEADAGKTGSDVKNDIDGGDKKAETTDETDRDAIKKEVVAELKAELDKLASAKQDVKEVFGEVAGVETADNAEDVYKQGCEMFKMDTKDMKDDDFKPAFKAAKAIRGKRTATVKDDSAVDPDFAALSKII